MAVFQGARLRSGPLQATEAAVDSRAAAPATVRSAPRVRPIGLLMAAILAATIVGLLYLTQTLGSNATSSEIRELAAASEKLSRNLRNQAYAVEVHTDPDEVLKRARKLGLSKLDGAVVVLPVPASR